MFAKAQTAMEYVTTYGWMFVILITVLAALVYIGFFTPRPLGCSFSGAFNCRAWKLTTDGNLTLDLYQYTGHDINVTGINCTMNPNSNSPPLAVTAFIRNNDHGLVANGTNLKCLDIYGNTATGTSGAYYGGTVQIYYTENDTGMQHFIKGTISVKYE